MAVRHVLVDSGFCQNIGDKAMLENTLSALLERTNWILHIVPKASGELPEMSSDRVLRAPSSACLSKVLHWRLNSEAMFLLAALYWTGLAVKICRLFVASACHAKYGWHLVRNPEYRDWIEFVERTNAYWVVGGGYMNDMGRKAMVEKMLIALLFSWRAKPIVCSGQSIGPLDKLSSRLVMGILMRRATLVSLRERESYRLLDKYRFNMDHVHVTSDDALTCNFRQTMPKRNVITLNIRSGFYAECSERDFAKYASFIVLLHERWPNAKIYFLPIALGQDDSDIVSAERVISLLPEKVAASVGICTEADGVADLIAFLQTSFLSIGFSYHFCLFSLIAEVPTLALYAEAYYRHKNVGLMNMFGCGEWCCDLMQTTPEDLFNAACRLYETHDPSSVRAHFQGMEQKWNDFLMRAIDTVENWS